MLKRPLAAVIVLLTLAPPALAADDYRAEVRRTTGGWAHVKAADHGSLGFGYGYAYAQDQACELAEIVVTVNAGRSAGVRRRRRQRRVGLLLAADQGHADGREARRAARRRTGLRATARATDPRLRGRLQRVPARARHRTTRAAAASAGCARSATLDLYRRFYQLGLRASSGNFRDEIVAAQPPAAAAGRAPATAPTRRRSSAGSTPSALGSNAYGIGSAGTRGNGDRSLVLGNPHFPWEGSERWYEIHLTIPGKLNVIGAALQGVPAVNIGFTRGVAWSHTVSTARRFTPYELQLRPRQPDAVRGRRPRR